MKNPQQASDILGFVDKVCILFSFKSVEKPVADYTRELGIFKKPNVVDERQGNV